jgi:hypothetical protein
MEEDRLSLLALQHHLRGALTWGGKKKNEDQQHLQDRKGTGFIGNER